MHRAVLALLLAGCSYDWSYSAEPPTDAGRDVVPADASVADAPDAQGMDATTSPDVADAGPTDSGSEDEAAAPDCMQLKQAMDDALYPAITCDGGCTLGVCSKSVADQCNCPVHVCDDMSNGTANYLAAVNAYKIAGCTSTYLPCGDTCPFTGTSCSLGDAANTFACYY